MPPLAKLRYVLLHNFLARFVCTSPLVPTPSRWRLLRLLGVDIDRSYILPGLTLCGMNVRIAEGCYLNYDVLIDQSVTLGRNVGLGHGTKVLTGTHEVGSPERRWGVPMERPVVIGDGCWVGAEVTILPGVTIGSGCIIASGAVVTRDCAPDGVYMGVPARRVQEVADLSTTRPERVER